jgi:hypothetical protein
MIQNFHDKNTLYGIILRLPTNWCKRNLQNFLQFADFNRKGKILLCGGSLFSNQPVQGAYLDFFILLSLCEFLWQHKSLFQNTSSFYESLFTKIKTFIVKYPYISRFFNEPHSWKTYLGSGTRIRPSSASGGRGFRFLNFCFKVVWAERIATRCHPVGGSTVLPVSRILHSHPGDRAKIWGHGGQPAFQVLQVISAWMDPVMLASASLNP